MGVVEEVQGGVQCAVVRVEAGMVVVGVATVLPTWEQRVCYAIHPTCAGSV